MVACTLLAFRDTLVLAWLLAAYWNSVPGWPVKLATFLQYREFPEASTENDG